MLSAGTNPFVGSWLGGATLAALELVVLRWLAEAIGLVAPGVGEDEQPAGVFTSGGSMANLTGLGAARARFGHRALERGVLYFSEQGHTSAEKAALVLGFREGQIRTVATDDAFRMRLDDLSQQVSADRERGLQPMLVCANAGTTNTGSVDPLPEIAELCQRESLWLHIDAAYGGFAAITKRGRERLEGLDRADSISLDPHKWLYSPMGTGCAYVKRRGDLEAAFETYGDYLKDLPPDEVHFFDRGPELSRPARALSVWMLLRTVGLRALEEQIDHDLDLALYAEQLLRESGFDIVAPTALSVVCFRHTQTPECTAAEWRARDEALVKALLEDGRVMLSSTDLHGEPTLRFVVMNARTDAHEIETSVGVIAELSAGGDAG